MVPCKYGRISEAATGEVPSPTPGPSDPVKIPTPKRVPRIYQDAAAPPAPELAEAEMAKLLEEAAQAEQDAARREALKLGKKLWVRCDFLGSRNVLLPVLPFFGRQVLRLGRLVLFTKQVELR